MNINTDILKKYFGDFIIFYDIYADQDAETLLTKALCEIQSTIPNENCTDSEAVEKIVLILEKYNLIVGTK